MENDAEMTHPPSPRLRRGKLMTQPQIIIPGFQFSGIFCGIKDNPKKKDLTFIYSEEPDTLIDGVFTQNKVVAAPVTVCRENIKKNKGQLIVINSGIANACTGAQGFHDAKMTQKKAAELFKIPVSSIYICSTGKIADLLPMDKLIGGLPKAKENLSIKNFHQAVSGIMTTDQYPKWAHIKGEIEGKPYTIAVLAKGAGMLCPNMATMLAFVVTDLCFSKPDLKKIFRNAVNITLNRITVDGDTSTNDTVLMMANGRAGNKPFKAESAIGKKIQKELTQLLDEMARAITFDGEGATKCCKVVVKNAKTESDAKKIAYAIGNSLLVKTALFGCDPNWGRVLAAVGYSGADIKQEKITLNLGPYVVAEHGIKSKKFNLKDVEAYMKKKDIEIKVDCKMGRAEFFVYMSDLTYDYIHLNAEYHT